MPYLPPHTIQLIKGKQTHPCTTLSLLAKQHTKQGTKKNRNIANNDSNICFYWPPLLNLLSRFIELLKVNSTSGRKIIWHHQLNRWHLIVVLTLISKPLLVPKRTGMKIEFFSWMTWLVTLKRTQNDKTFTEKLHQSWHKMLFVFVLDK